jgi:predicted ATP-dependent protease
LGLDGNQGVLIPSRNRRHLMLSAQVIHAVEKNLFKIYAVESASEGMELLTGLQFGSDEMGSYLDQTVLGHAQKTLKRYRSSLISHEKQAKNHKNDHVR